MSIYMVIPGPEAGYVKVGKTGKIIKTEVVKYLYQRYRTPFGKKLILYIWECKKDYHQEEKDLFLHFIKNKSEGDELFSGQNISQEIFNYCGKNINSQYSKYFTGQVIQKQFTASTVVEHPSVLSSNYKITDTFSRKYKNYNVVAACSTNSNANSSNANSSNFSSSNANGNANANSSNAIVKSVPAKIIKTGKIGKTVEQVKRPVGRPRSTKTMVATTRPVGRPKSSKNVSTVKKPVGRPRTVKIDNKTISDFVMIEIDPAEPVEEKEKKSYCSIM